MTTSEMVVEEFVTVSSPRVGRYRLMSPLGSGGMGRVFRAFDRLTGEMVALKQLHDPAGTHFPTPMPTPSQAESTNDPRLTLAREFQAMSTLRHPNILAVLDYGFNDGQPYFTMELLEEAQTVVEYTRGKALDSQIPFLIQILQALAYIHRRGLLHRDLKPGNILVTNAQVKVLDFGLSIDADQATGTVGTLAYMPPEVLFGNPAGTASDLYSFGLVAYEMLTGRHLFYQPAGDQLAIMNRLLDAGITLELSAIPPVLQPIFSQLLAWQPEARYQDATQVITQLSEAIHQSFPLETSATRESFLQAARFVGRESEFQQLRNSLIRAMDGHGATWLVGGESGVGKSRLADELRTQALIRGGLVLRGRAVMDGGSPFALWRDILRSAVLLSPLTDLEAGILQTILPQITILLEREILPPPELSPTDAQVRLFSTITDLLRRQQQPVVIILEDLHWATVESLALLGWLRRLALDQPWLIVGNYRDDERADLPNLLPGFQLMKLKRLSPEAIATLSQSMLGNTGRNESVLTFLQHETEGNPFFLVEIVRALAEEVGQLDKIGVKTLPEHVFTGGLENLVKRRLAQVAPAGQNLLQLAAIAGRALDLKLLQALSPTFDLAEWLNQCANAAVLDVQDERWQFAHDKLREGVLARVPAGQRPTLHRQIAQTIETVYPDRPDMSATLAYHWAMAEDKGQEAHYTAIAGREALRSGANQAAVTYLSRALELDQQGARPANAVPYLEQLRLHRRLGQAHLGLGQLEESLHILTKTLSMAKYPVPAGKPQLLFSLLSQIGRQMVYRLRPGRFVPSIAPEQVASILETVYAYQQVGEIYYFTNKQERLLNAGLTALNLAEQSGSLSEMARACGSMSMIAGIVGLDRIATTYVQLALTTAHQAANLPALAWVFVTTGTYTITTGQWAKASELLDQAITTSQQVGDKRIYSLSVGVRQLVPYYQGHFAESRALSQHWYRTAHETDNLQHQLLALASDAENQIHLGQLEMAQQLVDKSRELLAVNPTETVYSEQYRLQAIASALYLQQGQPEAAGREADLALRLMPHVSAPNQIIMADGITNLAEVYLSLWAAGQENYRPQAQEVCRLLNRYGRVFAIVAARAAIMQGFYEQLMGNPAGAKRLWHKGLTLAQQLGMNFEVGLAHFYLGRYASRPERNNHLAQAKTTFQELGAIGDLARLETIPID